MRAKVALRKLPVDLHRKAQICLAKLGAATSLTDLKTISGNRRGDRKGQYSIRINTECVLAGKIKMQLMLKLLIIIRS